MSSHDCLINGIGLHGKTDSNDDSLLSVAKKWKPTWLQHHLDEPPVAVQMVVEAAPRSLRWTGGKMRCTAFYDMRLKPLHERSELCGEDLSA